MGKESKLRARQTHKTVVEDDRDIFTSTRKEKKDEDKKKRKTNRWTGQPKPNENTNCTNRMIKMRQTGFRNQNHRKLKNQVLGCFLDTLFFQMQSFVSQTLFAIPLSHPNCASSCHALPTRLCLREPHSSAPGLEINQNSHMTFGSESRYLKKHAQNWFSTQKTKRPKRPKRSTNSALALLYLQ